MAEPRIRAVIACLALAMAGCEEKRSPGVIDAPPERTAVDPAPVPDAARSGSAPVATPAPATDAATARYGAIHRFNDGGQERLFRLRTDLRAYLLAGHGAEPAHPGSPRGDAAEGLAALGLTVVQRHGDAYLVRQPADPMRFAAVAAFDRTHAPAPVLEEDSLGDRGLAIVSAQVLVAAADAGQAGAHATDTAARRSEPSSAAGRWLLTYGDGAAALAGAAALRQRGIAADPLLLRSQTLKKKPGSR